MTQRAIALNLIALKETFELPRHIGENRYSEQRG